MGTARREWLKTRCSSVQAAVWQYTAGSAPSARREDKFCSGLVEECRNTALEDFKAYGECSGACDVLGQPESLSGGSSRGVSRTERKASVSGLDLHLVNQSFVMRGAAASGNACCGQGWQETARSEDV